VAAGEDEQPCFFVGFQPGALLCQARDQLDHVVVFDQCRRIQCSQYRVGVRSALPASDVCPADRLANP